MSPHTSILDDISDKLIRLMFQSAVQYIPELKIHAPPYKCCPSLDITRFFCLASTFPVISLPRAHVNSSCTCSGMVDQIYLPAADVKSINIAFVSQPTTVKYYHFSGTSYIVAAPRNV